MAKKLSKEVTKLLKSQPDSVKRAITTAAESNHKVEMDRVKADAIIARGPLATKDELRWACQVVARELTSSS